MDIEEILGFQPDLIFFRCACPWHSSDLNMAQILQKLSPRKNDLITLLQTKKQQKRACRGDKGQTINVFRLHYSN